MKLLRRLAVAFSPRASHTETFHALDADTLAALARNRIQVCVLDSDTYTVTWPDALLWVALDGGQRFITELADGARVVWAPNAGTLTLAPAAEVMPGEQ